MEVTPTFRTARTRDFYLAYMNSAAWRTVRNAALKRADYHCARCDSGRDLQVHHLTYERLGCEWASDLEVLCVDCHEKEHIKQFEGSNDAIFLKIAREALKANPFLSFADLSEDAKTLCARYKVPYNSAVMTRALELVTGSGLKKRDVRPLDRTQLPDPRVISAQDAHECLARLKLRGYDVDGMMRPMPSMRTDPVVHEARVRAQANVLRQVPPKRKPLMERLLEIFS